LEHACSDATAISMPFSRPERMTLATIACSLEVARTARHSATRAARVVHGAQLGARVAKVLRTGQHCLEAPRSGRRPGTRNGIPEGSHRRCSDASAFTRQACKCRRTFARAHRRYTAPARGPPLRGWPGQAVKRSSGVVPARVRGPRKSSMTLAPGEVLVATVHEGRRDSVSMVRYGSGVLRSTSA
jgi:hypothetical protein